MATGWHAEAFARTKRMKPLAKYLEPPETGQAKQDRKMRRFMAALDAMEKRGSG